MCIINELTTAKYNNTVVSLPYHLLDTTSCFPYKNDAPQKGSCPMGRSLFAA